MGVEVQLMPGPHKTWYGGHQQNLMFRLCFFRLPHRNMNVKEVYMDSPQVHKFLLGNFHGKKKIVSSFGFSSSVLKCLRYDKLPKSGWILWSLSSHWGTTTAIPSSKAHDFWDLDDGPSSHINQHQRNYNIQPISSGFVGCLAPYFFHLILGIFHDFTGWI